MSDDLVERVAREICCPPHLGHCCPEECSVHHFLPTARAAIAVVLEEAAIYCEMKSNDYWCEGYECCDSTLQQAAAAIRALKESK